MAFAQRDVCRAIAKIFKLQESQVTPTMTVVVFLTLVIVATLEISQLLLALVGAAAYAILQIPRGGKNQQKPLKGKGFSKKWDDTERPDRSYERRPPRAEISTRVSNTAGGRPERQRAQKQPAPTIQKGPEIRQTSQMPVVAPSFTTADWEGQVKEILTQITPTAAGDLVVSRLADCARETVQTLIPEADVMGFASGDIARGTAFGVAVPEVDIIVSIDPAVITQRLQTRLSKGCGPTTRLDKRKLQKSAIRACTDLLVSKGGWKFRRSAFRGYEPKVTLLAPTSLGVTEYAIPVDFSVNTVIPFYNAALLTECGQIDSRARSLILLVKRWAKDRGICHAAKGHLPPYAWSLLAIYFLQVRAEDGPPLLPPLEGFKVSSGLAAERKEASPKAGTSFKPLPADSVSVGDLFKEFMRFYLSTIEWRKEAVSVRRGYRAAPDVGLPLHIILHEDGSTEVAPSIEDPFDPTRNLGEAMTESGVARMQEELARAARMLEADAPSLSELLEPWMPPEAEKDPEEGEANGFGPESESADKLSSLVGRLAGGSGTWD